MLLLALAVGLVAGVLIGIALCRRKVEDYYQQDMEAWNPVDEDAPPELDSLLP